MDLLSDRKKKLRRLAVMMGRQSARIVPPMPMIIDMLDMSLDPVELDYLLHMGTRLYLYEEAAARSMMSGRQFSEFFETLRRKGFLETEYDASGAQLYRLSAVAVGWYETQMHYRMGRPGEDAFSRRLHDTFRYLWKMNFFPLRPVQNAVLRSVLVPNQSIALLEPPVSGDPARRRIRVDQEIEVAPQEIHPAASAVDLIREHGGKNGIGLFPCVCRHGSSLVGDPCRLGMPRESCLVLGSYGRYWIEIGYGRSISVSEALERIAELHEKGAVHTVMYERDDIARPEIAICNCCWDCCGVFRPYNMGVSAFKFKCYVSARRLADAECKGCGKCARY